MNSDPTKIDIKGIDKAALLCALYNASSVQGMGEIHAKPGEMKPPEARKALQRSTYFDYLNGRVLKVELKHDTLDTRLYDRDRGCGAARAAIAHLLAVHA